LRRGEKCKEETSGANLSDFALKTRNIRDPSGPQEVQQRDHVKGLRGEGCKRERQKQALFDVKDKRQSRSLVEKRPIVQERKEVTVKRRHLHLTGGAPYLSSCGEGEALLSGESSTEGSKKKGGKGQSTTSYKGIPTCYGCPIPLTRRGGSRKGEIEE